MTAQLDVEEEGPYWISGLEKWLRVACFTMCSCCYTFWMDGRVYVLLVYARVYAIHARFNKAIRSLSFLIFSEQKRLLRRMILFDDPKQNKMYNTMFKTHRETIAYMNT